MPTDGPARARTPRRLAVVVLALALVVSGAIVLRARGGSESGVVTASAGAGSTPSTAAAPTEPSRVDPSASTTTTSPLHWNKAIALDSTPTTAAARAPAPPSSSSAPSPRVRSAPTTTASAPAPGVASDTTEPPLVFDGRLAFEIVPASTEVTLHDRLSFDMSVHNGTTEVVHVPARAVDAYIDRDPAFAPGLGGAYDGSAASLLHLLDVGTDQTVDQSHPRDPSMIPTGPRSRSVTSQPPMMAGFDVEPGTTVHWAEAWDVALSDASCSATVYVQRRLGLDPRWDPATPPIHVAADPLCVSSRAPAVEAAVSDPRAPDIVPGSGATGGGWFHDGRWTFSIFPTSTGETVPNYWITVDASTATVLDVQVAS